MFKLILSTLCWLSLLSAAQGIKCITCTGAKDSDCALKFDSYNSTNACTTADDNCYSFINSEGLVTRGCFGDQSILTVAECAGEKCELCKTGDFCNAKIFEATPVEATSAPLTTESPNTTAAPETTAAPTTAPQTTEAPVTEQPTAAPGTLNCISCNSKMDIKCLKEASSLNAAICSNSSCYTILWDNFYVRGCLADAVTEVKLICQNKLQTQCLTCNTDKCNVDKVNGAQMHSFATGLVTFVVIMALKNLLHVTNL